jgi:gliding motility-associated-like protein
MSLVQSTINGSWAGNPNGNTSMFSPAGLPTGALTLTYNTTSNPNPTLCPASSVLYIAVLNPTVPSITQVGPFCTVDAPVQLTVTPATGSFIPTPYLTAGGLFNPALSGVGNNQIQYMIGTSTCNAVDTKSISIEAFVPATVSGPLPDQCSTGQIVNLAPYAQSQAGSWSGPGVLGTGFNPGNSGVGVIVIQHATSSFPSGLCPDQKSTSVTVYSLATPVIASEGPFCNSAQPVSLRANPLGGVFQSSSTHAVSPGGLFNPAFAAIGSNVVNYSVAAGPCIAFTQTFIDVEEFVTAKFSRYLNPICKTNSPEDMNSYVQRTGGTWSGPGMLGSIFTPSNANVGNNNIIVYRTHSPTEYLCPDSSAMRIEVVDVPVLEVVASTVKGCAPLEVELNIPNTNAGDGEWTFGDGTTQPGLSATHVYNVPGTYSVTFNYFTQHTRCFTQSLLKDFIVIHELPKPAFTYGPYKEVTISDPEIKLQNLTPNLISNTYLWSIDQMYTTTEVDPQPVRFPKTGDYRISLTATSAQGCVNEVSDIIRVEPDFRVYIPNSFTPNFDGINDEFFPVFSPFGLDPKTYELEIFDRWGKSVFITKDVTKGWNGTVQGKGVDPMKQEVYIYKIKYKDLEGRIYNKNGSVTVTN